MIVTRFPSFLTALCFLILMHLSTKTFTDLKSSELADLSEAALVHPRTDLFLRYRAPRISGVDSGLEELTPIMALTMQNLS